MLIQITIKWFSLTLVCIFASCSPILTVLLGALCLESEQVTFGIVFKAVVAFGGVLAILLGTPESDQSEELTDVDAI